MTFRSVVMPAAASSVTCRQSTAARSAGVRATPARKRALYEWAICASTGAVRVTPLIHGAAVGGGNQSVAGPAGTGPATIAIAESR